MAGGTGMVGGIGVGVSAFLGEESPVWEDVFTKDHVPTVHNGVLV
jgi:hypothetical protein